MDPLDTWPAGGVILILSAHGTAQRLGADFEGTRTSVDYLKKLGASLRTLRALRKLLCSYIGSCLCLLV